MRQTNAKETIKKILDNRHLHNLDLHNTIPLLFSLVNQESGEDAAQELFREPNRFVQEAIKCASADLIIQFIRKYPQLREKFLRYINPSDQQKLQTLIRNVLPPVNEETIKNIENILNQIFTSLELSSVLRIEKRKSCIIIRESTSNQPTPDQRNLFKKIMLSNNLSVVLPIETTKITLMVSNNVIFSKLTAFSIPHSKINAAIVNEFAANLKKGLMEKSKPGNIELKLWAAIPEAIRKEWKNFNDALQKHILACVKPNFIIEDFSRLCQSDVLGDSFRSPIGLSVPKIPVRLPNQHLANGVSNEVYDLNEVLKFKGKDPINRGQFNLKDIIPATKAHQEILERKQKELDEHRASPGAAGPS